MDAKSNYLENAILNHILRNVALTSPTTVYAALFTVTPSDAGGGTEVTGGSYARQAVTFSAPSGGVCTNSGSLTYPVASANWGNIVAMGIFDALTVGNLLYYGPLSTPKTIEIGDQISFANAAISITEQ